MNKSTEYCVSHPDLHLAKACIKNISLQPFGHSLTMPHPDSVRHFRVQVRLIANLGLNVRVP